MRRRAECVVVWDCGATNTTVTLVGTDGRIVAQKARPTAVVRTADGLAWPFERMWRNFCALTKELLSATAAVPRAVNVTTFGVCWGAVGKRDRLLYPVISWKCTRTRESLDWARANLDLDAAYRITGAPPFYFNTAFSLRWMRDHRRDILEKAEAFLFMPQLFVLRLTGERVTERTMAATAMLFDLAQGAWSGELFRQFDVPNKFPVPVRSPSDVVGAVTAAASAGTGIPAGTPVCAGGHDTGLATAGACRDLRTSVLYSTGTWSILVATRDEYVPDVADRARNVLWEVNPHTAGVLGGYNRQGHMIGGLSFDLIRRKFAAGRSAAEASDRAARAPVGSGGVVIIPTFVARTGPNPEAPSAIIGWEDGMPPEYAVRAVLEGLACETRDSLSRMGGTVSAILVGGGFARNRLYGQILADVTGMAVELAGIPEVTTIGTAVLAMFGAGIAPTVEEAWRRVAMPVTTLTPADRSGYAAVYARHRKVVEALQA
jgi:L-fuculokinase